MSVVPEDLKKFAHVCPNFVIEVPERRPGSKSDNRKELENKMEKWIQNGVRLGWLVDLQSKTTTIYQPNEILRRNLSPKHSPAKMCSSVLR